MYKVIRGLYSTVPISNLNKYELATAVAGPYSYISTESVLFNNGIIMQQPKYITVIGLKNREYTLNNINIKIRALSPRFLHNRLGIIQNEGYSIATSIRAIADILHYNSKYYFDNLLTLSKNKTNKLSAQIYYDGRAIK